MSSPTQEITIGQAALNSLRQMVGGAGWAVSVEDICRGGQLLSVLPEVQVPESTDRRVITDWAAEPVKFSLTEKQRDLAKKALKYFADKGSVPPSANITALYASFGLFEP
jgi:hypothetical protein